MGMNIDRRRVLVGITAMMAGALSPAAAKAIEAAASYAPASGFKSLNADQVGMLRAVADTIIPETDTPSASGAGVDLYVDHMITAVLSKPEGKAVTDFLAAFLKKHPGFPDLSASDQLAVLTDIDSRLWEDTVISADYRALKEQVLIGYYTSEVGGSEELEYDPVPGPFHNGTVEDYSRTWST
jgi:gluconate 2-dehydrogenase gamma chain